jgi:outer membrane immunogenic protein
MTLRSIAKGLAPWGIAALAAASGALADGMPRYGSVKDAPYVAPFSWTGFYLGVNAGAAWVQSDVTLTSNPVFFGPGGVGGPDGPASLDRDGSARFRDTVFTGGGQIGANWQMGTLVLGIEADLNAVRFSASADSGVRPTPPLSPGLGTYRFIESVDSDWLATARARLGYAMDRTLIYVTGGAAWAKFDFTQQSGPFSGCGGGPLCTVTSSASGTKTGWAVGGGFEYAFTNNWTLKGEYLHADLGSVSFADNLAAGGFPAASFTHKADLTMDLARVGINYKF